MSDSPIATNLHHACAAVVPESPPESSDDESMQDTVSTRESARAQRLVGTLDEESIPEHLHEYQLACRGEGIHLAFFGVMESGILEDGYQGDHQYQLEG